MGEKAIKDAGGRVDDTNKPQRRVWKCKDNSLQGKQSLGEPKGEHWKVREVRWHSCDADFREAANQLEARNTKEDQKSGRKGHHSVELSAGYTATKLVAKAD